MYCIIMHMLNYDCVYCSTTMKRMLLEGITLIVDRYAFSGVAYSAAKPVRILLCTYDFTWPSFCSST